MPPLDTTAKGCNIGLTWNRNDGAVIVGHETLDNTLPLLVRCVRGDEPVICFTSIYINDGTRCKLHADIVHVGPPLAISLGPFIGGSLWQHTSRGGCMFPPWQLCRAYGRVPHFTTPQVRHRVSVISYIGRAIINAPPSDVAKLCAIGFPCPSS